MNQSGLSVRPATLLIVIAALACFSPALAQGDPSCSAIVSVVDDQGEAVAAGYKISLMFSAVDVREQMTDGMQISYSFEALPCGTAFAVVGEGSGGTVELTMLEALAREIVSLEAGKPLDVRLTIPAMIPVSVIAVDESGAPAAGGTITAIPGGDRRPAISSVRVAILPESGAATLQVPPGRYLMQTSFSEGQTVQSMTVDGAAFNAKEPLEVNDRPLELVIVVSSADRISGMVTDGEGQSIGRYRLIVRRPESGRDKQYELFGEDGRFQVTTTTFPVEVFVHDPGGNWNFEPVSILVPDKEHADGLHFTGRRFEGQKLRGRVLAGEPAVPAGRAFIDSKPNCYTGDGKPTVPRPVQIMADEDGEFELPCPEECHLYLEISMLWSDDYLTLKWYGGPEDCEQKQTFILEEGNTVTGVVTDSEGRPVSELVVSTLSGGGKGTTDDEGRYEIRNLGSGRYELQVKVQDEAAFSSWILLPDGPGKRPSVQFTSNGKTKERNLEVTKGGTVCLDLEDKEGTRIEVKHLVLVRPDEDQPAKVASRPIGRNSIQTDALCVGPLVPGDYHLRAGTRFSWFMPAWWPGTEDREEAALVSVLAGDRLELSPMTVRRAGPVQVNIKEGCFLRSKLPFLEFRVAIESKDPEEGVEEQEWDRVDQDELHFMAETKTPTDEGYPTYASMRFTPYPTGRYDVRVCETEGCAEGNVWCSPEPLEVEKRKGGEIELVLSEDPKCEPVNEMNDSTVPTHEGGAEGSR